jgi:Ca2+-binding RTX toxin-like protein
MAYITGDKNANQLIGTSNEDAIYAYGGNDLLDGREGDDFLNGGLGSDTVIGGDGNDRLNDGELSLFDPPGNDSLSGGNGNDSLSSYTGNDTIDGGAGNDYLTISFQSNSNANITYTAFDAAVGSGIITDGAGQSVTYSSIERFYLIGGDGNDDLRGGSDKDRFFGQAGNDTIAGGGGNDTLSGDVGNDFLNGGDGNDSLSDVGNDTLFGGAGDDLITIDGGASVDGGAGNDSIIIGGGRAIANGSADQDILFVNYNSSTSNITYSAFDPVNNSGTITNGARNSVIYQSIEAFVISGGFGNDDLRGMNGNDFLDASRGKDTLTGGTGNDILNGSFGYDNLNGGDGNDTLDGGGRFYLSTLAPEIDTLTGGAGSDRFRVGAFVSDAGRPTHFYDDRNNSTSGLGEYALVKDFNPAEDNIALSASGNPAIPSESQYVLGSSPISSLSGTAIYLNTDGAAGVGSTDELLAVLQGASNLSLTANYFNYVVDPPTPIGG